MLLAAGLLQMALFAYATAPGLAGTSDSGYYLHAAQTWRTIGQLLNPDGTPYRFWPPLYPLLLQACGSLGGIRMLHAACLLGSLGLWSWLGQQLLPTRRALLVPALLALSTPWLLVGKFVWAESVFMVLFAAYAAALWRWRRTGSWSWWAALTLAGLLLPLQRTLGLFLLAGAGVMLLADAWRQPVAARRGLWPVLLHLALSASGGVLWQWYALLVAGPSRYHPSRGWQQLLSSGADYGFVLSRWLLPLPTTARVLLPNVLWAAMLLGLLALLWPRRAAQPPAVDALAAGPAPIQPQTDAKLLLRALWAASVALILLVAGLTVFAQSAAGIHDAERYASVLFGPMVLLVLAAWPGGRLPGLAGLLLAALWLMAAGLRAGHVARDLRQLPPLADSVAGPGAHGQRVGAAGQ